MKERLVKCQEDNATYLRNGFANWKQNLTCLEDYFGEQIQVVDVSASEVDELNEELCSLVFRGCAVKKL